MGSFGPFVEAVDNNHLRAAGHGPLPGFAVILTAAPGHGKGVGSRQPGVVVTGHCRGHPQPGDIVVGFVGPHAVAPLGQFVGRGTRPGDAVEVVAVEHGLVGEVDPFGNPDRGPVGIDLIADGLPLLQAKTLLPPEENDRLALIAQIGRMLDVGSQQRGQGVGHRGGIAEEGAANLEIDGGLKTAGGGHVEQDAEVGFGLVVGLLRAVPGLHKSVDSGPLRLGYVPLDGSPIRRVVRLGRQIDRLAGGPGVLIEPGVVEGQHRRSFLGLDCGRPARQDAADQGQADDC